MTECNRILRIVASVQENIEALNMVIVMMVVDGIAVRCDGARTGKPVLGGG
jgi:hypothetical protein